MDREIWEKTRYREKRVGGADYVIKEREGEREVQRDSRERERESDRQTDIQTDRQRDRARDEFGDTKGYTFTHLDECDNYILWHKL